MSLDDVKRSVGHVLYQQIGRANGHLQNYRSLPVDVLEDETSYLVVFDAPGTEPEDVQVRYLDGRVRVRIDRFRQFRDRFEMRFPGRGTTLDGEAELPEDATVDPDAGTARLSETGTLRIEIPKEVTVDDADERSDPETQTAGDERPPRAERSSGNGAGTEEVPVED